MELLVLGRPDILREDITLNELAVVIDILDRADLDYLACECGNVKRIFLARERLVLLHIKNNKFTTVSYLPAEHLILPSRRPKTLYYYTRL